MALRDWLGRSREDRGSPQDAGASPHGQDWAAKATATVETVVELIRDKSVRPLLFAARVAVLALLGAAALTFLVIAGAAGLVRLLDNLVFSGHVWATDLTVGGIFALAGAFLIRLGDKEGGDARV